jgi:hypothetical protein
MGISLRNKRGPLDLSSRFSIFGNMCNRFRSIREWSQIPRDLYSGARINFAFNPNVAPTETVPVLIAATG